jgi:hypothetical protein
MTNQKRFFIDGSQVCKVICKVRSPRTPRRGAA